VEIPAEEWGKFKELVVRIDKNVNGNGKPPLEERLRDYIDERDDHKERNHRQDMTDIRSEIDEKHKENQKSISALDAKFDKFTEKVVPLVYIGMGIMIALESVGLFKK